MSKGGGGISIGTLAIIAWVLFAIFSGDDDEDTTTPPVEVKVEEPSNEVKIKAYDEIVSKIKPIIKDRAKEIKTGFDALVEDVKDAVKKEPKEKGTIILVRPESNKEEEAIPEDQIIEKDKEQELPELEENAPDDSELTFTPL